MFQKSYDSAGRMLSGQLGTGSSTLGYDGFGRRETIVHSDGGSGNFQRDLLDRLTQVTWTGPTPISVALGYDLAGNVTSLERESSSASTIAYDAVDQLLSSVGGSTEARSFSYDGVGNRLTDSLNGAGNFISNFLASNGVASYVADPNGFGDTIQETKGGVTKNFFYRADGRISGFQSGNLQVAYYYDALDRLAAKAINDNGNSYTQSFAYVGRDKDLFQAKAGDGSITTYLNGNGPDDHIAQLKDGVYKGYVTDQIGSILNSEMAGPSKRFSLFGDASGSAPLSMTSDPASFGYAGGMHNRESKTTKFDWRDLNHDTGRWQTQEPSGADGPSLYWYAKNSPLRYVDRNGLQSSAQVEGGGVGCDKKRANFIERECRNLPRPGRCIEKAIEAQARCEKGERTFLDGYIHSEDELRQLGKEEESDGNAQCVVPGLTTNPLPGTVPGYGGQPIYFPRPILVP